jgi:hypothetical protein
VAIKFLDPGSDATYTVTTFWSTSGNTPETWAGQFRHGQRSIRCSSSSSNLTSYISNKLFTLSASGGRIFFGIFFNSLPSGTVKILEIRSLFGATQFALQITSGGVLQLTNAAGGVVGTGATLSTGVWNRIALCYAIGANDPVKIFVNGAESISVADLAVSSAPTAMRLGWIEAPGADKSLYLDDIYVDDVTSLADPGDITVTAKLPNGNGLNADFNSGIGSTPTSRYTNVDDRPLNTTTGWERTASSQGDETYTLQGKTSGDVDIQTGYAYLGGMAWLVGERGATVGSEGTPGIILNGGSDTITLTTSPEAHIRITTLYPSGSNAIGMRSTGNDNNTTLYEIGFVAAARVTERSVPSTAAIKTTLTRTVSPVTAALSRSLITRTLSPVTAALLKTLTRTLTPITAAIKTTLTRTVTPATAALQTTLTRTVTPVTAAIQSTDLTRTVTPVTATLRAAGFVTTPATATLQTTLTRTLTPISASISNDGVKLVPMTAALKTTANTLTTPASAALYSFLTRTLTPVSAALHTLITRTLTPITAALYSALTNTVSPVTAALQTTLTITTPATAAISNTPTLTVTPVTAVITSGERLVPATVTLVKEFTRTLTPITAALSTKSVRSVSPVTAYLAVSADGVFTQAEDGSVARTNQIRVGQDALPLRPSDS